MDPEGGRSGGVTSFNEPLLKNYPSLEEGESNEAQGTGSTPPPEQYNPTHEYVFRPRPFRDIAFTVVFVILVLASAAFGIFSIVNHNSDFGLVDSALYNSSSGLCSTSYGYRSFSWEAVALKQTSSLGRLTNYNAKKSTKQILLGSWKVGWIQTLSQEGLRNTVSGSSIISALIWTLVITFVLSVPFIIGILWLLKAFAKQLVYTCLPLFVLIPVLLNIFWFVACTVTNECQEAFNLAGRIAVFVFIFVLCGIFAWIIFSNWGRVDLTICIMQTAAEALLRNWGLLLVLPSLTLALLIYLVPFVVFLIYAYMNGDIVATPDSYCEGEAVTDCCSWSVSSWVPAYFVLAIFTALWSALTMAEAQIYSISGTIAQWYFATTGSRVTGSIRHSLGNAFGPSFGTVCFSGLVLSFVRMIRAVVDIAQNEQSRQGCFFYVTRCIANYILYAIEFLNKFTINFAAILGESYCTSARMAYELLKRNLLSPVFVEVISTRLLAGIAFVISAVYAVVLCAILKSATSLGGASYYLTALAWALLFILLLLFNEVLDNVIDTVYICYAIDKDAGSVSKPEVHDVCLMLPLSRDQPPRLAVQQP